MPYMNLCRTPFNDTFGFVLIEDASKPKCETRTLDQRLVTKHTGTGAMTDAAADYNPTSRNEAEEITQRVAGQLDTALLLAGDRGDDDLYTALMDVRTAFLNTMAQTSSGLSELMQINTAVPVPALVLANRLYQDASRANELIQEASVPHPAFMPTTMKVLRQ